MRLHSAKMPTLAHLLFADNTLLFGRDSIEEATKFKLIIENYSTASGQWINQQKSDIYFSKNTSILFQKQIADILGIPTSSMLSRYLGLLVSWRRSKYQSLQFIKDRVWHKLQSWKCNLLSLAGKEILIKAVVQAIPSYVMSVFLLPLNFINDIQKLAARFWWPKISGYLKYSLD